MAAMLLGCMCTVGELQFLTSEVIDKAKACCRPATSLNDETVTVRSMGQPEAVC